MVITAAFDAVAAMLPGSEPGLEKRATGRSGLRLGHGTAFAPCSVPVEAALDRALTSSISD
jgi:hypothetical protein